VETGRYRHDGGITVSNYLDGWIADKSAHLRATTLRDYGRHIGSHIVPSLGHLRLGDLRTSHVTRLLQELLSGARGTPPLGRTSVRRVHATPRSALRDAVRAELIEYNAAQNAVVPSRPRTRVNPWEPEELGAFLDHVAADPLGPVFELIANTGLRRGESAGLRWSDVNLEDGILVIRQQIVQLAGAVSACQLCGGEHRGILFGPPKTASGEARRVDLSGQATGALLMHKLAQDAAREKLGSAYRDHDLVFAQPSGDPINPERLTKRFGELLAEAGLRRVRLHDLRHGRASLLLASGSDLTVVSKTMGHSSYSFTADTYAHLLAGAGKQAAEAADALIPRKPSDQSVTSSESETKMTPPDGDGEGVLTCRYGCAPSGTRTPNPLKSAAGFLVSSWEALIRCLTCANTAPTLARGHRPFGGLSL